RQQSAHVERDEVGALLVVRRLGSEGHEVAGALRGSHVAQIHPRMTAVTTRPVTSTASTEAVTSRTVMALEPRGLPPATIGVPSACWLATAVARTGAASPPVVGWSRSYRSSSSETPWTPVIAPVAENSGRSEIDPVRRSCPVSLSGLPRWAF